MQTTPKSLRLHIAIFGRTNVGKSSFLNFVLGQDLAITSEIPGTTTDVVEKTMELLPVGPVVFLDTAGIDDISALGPQRIKKAKKVIDRADVMLIILEPNIWTDYEETLVKEAQAKKIPIILIINKIDLTKVSAEFIDKIKVRTKYIISVSSLDLTNRDKSINILKNSLLELFPDFLNNTSIFHGLIQPKGLAIFIVPIDFEAPKGRIILPQVQAIRAILDNDASVLVVKEHQYKDTLKKLKDKPDLVVCDSQVVDRMISDTPLDIPCTTFSILFSRFRGDLPSLIKGVKVIDSITNQDRILIAESCTHHAIEDDIGRIKIPKWLNEYKGFKVNIDVCSGLDYPENLKNYKLIIHCGGCMINRKEMLSRINKALSQGVSITNYGICISFLKGVLARVLSPFNGLNKQE